MIRYRPFRNTDPPVLAEIWRSQAPLHRLAQPMTAALWEQSVLSKAWFDPKGLIVACEGPRPIGFVHAGFGPAESSDRLDYSRGIVSRLLAGPHADRGVVMTELLSAAEDYLTKAGACEAFIDHVDALGPFYLGLYGGSTLTGVLNSDDAQVSFFTSHDYVATGERLVMQRSLTGFRPPVDRDQMRLRKLYQLVAHHDCVAQTWWEACATSHLERSSFELQAKTGAVPASMIVAHLDAFSGAWGVQTVGIQEVKALPESWADGSALLLIADASKVFQTQGVMLMEAVVDPATSSLAKVLTTLGFKEVDRGVVLRKQLR